MLTQSEVKNKFKIINRNLNILRLLSLLAFIPVGVLYFSDLDVYFGLTKHSASIPLLIGAAINLLSVAKYWKCPACGKKPGSSIKVNKCSSCGAVLN